MEYVLAVVFDIVSNFSGVVFRQIFIFLVFHSGDGQRSVRLLRAPDPSVRLTGVLESASMLMSRHLRGTVERSLESFVNLFESEGTPPSAETSVPLLS